MVSKDKKIFSSKKTGGRHLGLLLILLVCSLGVAVINKTVVIPMIENGAGSSTAETLGYTDAMQKAQAEEAAAEEKPYRLDISIAPLSLPGQSGKLRLIIADPMGAPVTPGTFSVRFAPEDPAAKPFTPLFRQADNGLYETEAAFPSAGEWTAEITVKKDAFTQKQSVKIRVGSPTETGMETEAQTQETAPAAAP